MYWYQVPMKNITMHPFIKFIGNLENINAAKSGCCRLFCVLLPCHCYTSEQTEQQLPPVTEAGRYQRHGAIQRFPMSLSTNSKTHLYTSLCHSTLPSLCDQDTQVYRYIESFNITVPSTNQ